MVISKLTGPVSSRSYSSSPIATPCIAARQGSRWAVKVAGPVSDDATGQEGLSRHACNEEAPAAVACAPSAGRQKRRRRHRDTDLDLRTLSRVVRRGKRPDQGEAARKAVERAAAEEADRKEASVQREQEGARIRRKRAERSERRSFLAAVSEREVARDKAPASEAAQKVAEMAKGLHEGTDKGGGQGKRRK